MQEIGLGLSPSPILVRHHCLVFLASRRQGWQGFQYVLGSSLDIVALKHLVIRYLHCKNVLKIRKSQISISYLMKICARNVGPAEHETKFDSVCSGIGPSHQETGQAMKKKTER